MLEIILSVAVSVNVGLAVWHALRLRRLHRRERELLQTVQLWRSIQQGELRQLIAYRVHDGYDLSETAKGGVYHYTEIWRS